MRAWLIVWIALATATPARAQDAGPPEPEPAPPPQSEGTQVPGLLERWGVSGALRAGYWSSTRNLDAERPLVSGMLWLKTTRRVSSHAALFAEGWAAMRGPLESGDAAAELREAFVDVKVGHLDVRAGRQIIAWGRADGVNPTDNLSGQDLTLLVPDDVDRRLGTTAVRASYYVGDVSFTAVWLPEFRGHAFALPAPPPDVSLVREGQRWPADQWAARVEQTGRAVDWSVSYFRGKDMAPDLGVGARSDGAPGMLLSHHRVQVFGADVAANLAQFGLRAEGAYVETDDTRGTDPFTKNPFVFVVGGTDRTWGGLLNLNVQYLFRYVLDDPTMPSAADFASVVAAQQAILNSQTRRAQHGASFRLAYKWLRETLEAECAAAAWAGPTGLTVRPKLVYAATDDWKVLAGAEIFRGESASLFGLLRENSTAYLEARWSF